MADKEYIRAPFHSEFQGVSPSGYRFLQSISECLNELSCILKNMGTYANNGAAVAGGLSVGDIYKTATGELRIVV